MFSRYFIVFISLFLFPYLASAKVAGISGSQKFVDSKGTPGVRAVVRCLTSNVPRTIVRLEGERQWCDSEVVSVCRGNKLNAAKKVCSSSYRKALENHLAGKPAVPAPELDKAPEVAAKPTVVEKSTAVAVKKVDTSAAQTELFDIEQKRVQIKQRQLELRKLELELEKQRASDLESGF